MYTPPTRFVTERFLFISFLFISEENRKVQLVLNSQTQILKNRTNGAVAEFHSESVMFFFF